MNVKMLISRLTFFVKLRYLKRVEFSPKVEDCLGLGSQNHRVHQNDINVYDNIWFHHTFLENTQSFLEKNLIFLIIEIFICKLEF